MVASPNFRPAKKWYEGDFVDEAFSKGKEGACRLMDEVEVIRKEELLQP